MGEHVFVRKASGLVREVGIFEAFAASVSWMVIAMGLLVIVSGPMLFPGGDLVLATLIISLFAVFHSLLYCLFSWAMPRSGGDYVSISRVLHPFLGFVMNFNATLWYTLFGGLTFNWIVTLGLAPSLTIIGVLTNNQGWISMANTISEPAYTLLIGTVVVLFYIALCLRGTKPVLWVTNIIFAISMVGFIIAIVVLATHSRADFVNAFSKFGSYQSIINAAHSSGYSPTSQNPLWATLGLTPLIWGTVGYGMVASYFAGELKTVKKNMFISSVVTVFFAAAILVIICGLSVNVFGYDFLGSFATLQANGSPAYPFGAAPAYFNLLLIILLNNPAVTWLLTVTFIAAVVAGIGPNIMAGTRNIFAWSFDRVVPETFSKVSDRFHAPTNAILLMGVILEIGLIAQTFGAATLLSFVAGAGVGQIICYMTLAIAGIAFPWRRKDIYEKSPANIKLVGIPLIVVTSVLALCAYIWMEAAYWTNPIYGVIGGSGEPLTLGALGLGFLVPAIIWVVSYYYHKSQGVDLMLGAKEVPPL